MAQQHLASGLSSFFATEVARPRSPRCKKRALRLVERLGIIRLSLSLQKELQPENLEKILTKENLEKALTQAATEGRHGDIVFLLDNFAIDALGEAARTNQGEVIRFLLEEYPEKIDVNKQYGPHKQTALHWAVEAHASEAAEILIDRGARADIADSEGKTVIDLQLIQLLKTLELEIDYQVAKSDINILGKALRKAANNNCDKEIIVLLDHFEIDINSQDTGKTQRTALHWATEKRYVDIIALLIDRGARTDIPDATGKTVRDIARDQGIDLPNVNKFKPLSKFG